jgi:hypothetical protein
MVKKYWFMLVGALVLFGFLYSIGWFDAKTDETPIPATRTITLSFYDPARDRDASGNVLCSAQGLVPVSREIPHTNTPIQDVMRLLLSSTPTSEERGRGLVSEFPLAGVELKAASLNGGILTLTFTDPDHRTGGGSCFVSILRAQVEETAKQFPEVREVRLAPDDLFQP